ncbi:SID1 transmembrane family member 1 [Fasciolopsis buskii]|uniref:SID1 transmembrane family member 1 n=1 Tax=Fasciolopsis buskii TaxID=27845 RepID=A0A8E0VGR6_9TREM|nr:SID1 transmembrane family member 1 [Fasciolopsis buski]
MQFSLFEKANYLCLSFENRSQFCPDDTVIPDSSAPPVQVDFMARSWHSDEAETRPQVGPTAPYAGSSLPRSAGSECALTVPVHGSHSHDLFYNAPDPSVPVPVEAQPFSMTVSGSERESDFVGNSTTAIQPKSSKPSHHSRIRRRSVDFSRSACRPAKPFGQLTAGDEELTAVFHSELGSNAPLTIGSRNTTIPTLIDLSRKPYIQLNRKYMLYFWFLIIISVFYGLPAVQLIMIYQKALVETGNEDLCYYNFECARPLGIFTAFNNIISNVGYMMLGLLFLALTARRDLLHRRALKFGPSQAQTRGIPQHYGLYYSMGLALTMEGIMSACYHMCPSFSNFQFDTAYMYILAMLIMLKIYQTRHPDVNATAHSAYMVMAIVIFLGVTGVLYGSETFWIAFTVLFLLMSVILTAEIYYMGHWNIDLCLPRRLYSLIQSDGIHCLKPMYLERMILLLIANMVNFTLPSSPLGLYFYCFLSAGVTLTRFLFCLILSYSITSSAGYGIVTRPRNFSSFLLTIFMVNMLVYTMFYIIMKLRNRERFLPLPVVFMVFAIVSWSISIYFFFSRLTTWEVTPAQSRALNQPCLLLSFYDAHDIWHFMSAISMFFSFLVSSDHSRHDIPAD